MCSSKARTTHHRVPASGPPAVCQAARLAACCHADRGPARRRPWAGKGQGLCPGTRPLCGALPLREGGPATSSKGDATPHSTTRLAADRCWGNFALGVQLPRLGGSTRHSGRQGRRSRPQVWHSRLGPPAWHPRFGPLPAAAQRAGLACGPDRTLGNVTTAKFYRPCLIYISWMAVFQVVGSADGAFPQHCTPYCAAVKLAGRLKAAGASAPLAAEAAWTDMPPTARSTASC